MTAPFAAADPLDECAHSVEHLVNLGDHIDAVDDQRAPARHAQGDVERGAVLGGVDVVAVEHRLAPLGDAGLRASCASSPIVSSVIRFFE